MSIWDNYSKVLWLKNNFKWTFSMIGTSTSIIGMNLHREFLLKNLLQKFKSKKDQVFLNLRIWIIKSQNPLKNKFKNNRNKWTETRWNYKSRILNECIKIKIKIQKFINKKYIINKYIVWEKKKLNLRINVNF